MPAPPAYVGEPSVTREWLQQREVALGALRTDYEAQRAGAQRQGSGPGWTLVERPNQDGEPTRELTFDEPAFRAHYLAQLPARNPSALAGLTQAYAIDLQGLTSSGASARLLCLALDPNRVPNAGPAPAGHAMGDAQQLGRLDLYLADPQIRDLINRYGGTAPAATSTQAREQASLLGQARFDQLGRLANAMEHVRGAYLGALAQAQRGGQGPGWVDRVHTIVESSGGVDEGGQPLPGYVQTTRTVVDRVFDPDAFTAWYIAQPGAAHQGFGSFYGPSTTTLTREDGYTSSQDGITHASQRFANNPGWVVYDGLMVREGLERLNLNDLPRLHDPSKIFYDIDVGWVTPQDNLHLNNGLEREVGVIFVAAVAYVSAGTLGYEAAVGMGLTTGATNTAGAAVLSGTGLVVSAGVVGAATSIASGLVNGNVQLRDVLRGAFVGALTAGLMNQLNAALPAGTGTAVQIGARVTLQGSIQALLGGSFRDGALTALAAELANLSSSEINQAITDSVNNGTMSAGEALTARTFARMFSSAVRAMGNPDDPMHAFASSFVSETLSAAGGTQAAPTVSGPAFDDDGNLMPGIVDPRASPQEQAAQLTEALRRQGLSTEEAVQLALDTIRLDTPTPLQPPSAASRTWTPEEMQRRVDEVERHVLEDLAAQQARDDSLLGPDEVREPVGGPGPVRPPIQPVLNGRFDLALNAVGDMAGVMQPLAELRGALGQLQAAQVEGRIETLRQALRTAGVPNVPADYALGLDGNGNLNRDYGATIDRPQRTYDNFVLDQRYTETWGADWRSIRIGNSNMSVAEFERRTLEVQQREANDAYARGARLIATGQLPLRNGDYATTLGIYVDQESRFALRAFGANEGLPDTASANLFAVNRRMTGQGVYGVPDLRLGANLISDVSLAPKDGLTEQLQRWNLIRPNDTMIIRPDALGGSYVVPRSTIRPPNPSGGSGR